MGGPPPPVEELWWVSGNEAVDGSPVAVPGQQGGCQSGRSRERRLDAGWRTSQMDAEVSALRCPMSPEYDIKLSWRMNNCDDYLDVR